MATFAFTATVGILIITGRAIEEGGGFCVNDKRRTIEPLELLPVTVQTYSFAEYELFAVTLTVVPVYP